MVVADAQVIVYGLDIAVAPFSSYLFLRQQIWSVRSLDFRCLRHHILSDSLET